MSADAARKMPCASARGHRRSTDDDVDVVRQASAAAPPDPAALAASLFVTVGACFGTMFIGVLVARNSLLSADARRASRCSTRLVFPAMVFRGVAAIDLGAVDPTILGVMLLSKWALALCGLAFGALAGRGLAAGAMYAMAVSHSFDVSLGVPIARVLYPAELPYVYLNQSVQHVLVNPVLLVLMELGGGGGGAGVWRRALASTATNPLVVMTALGLAAALALPAGHRSSRRRRSRWPTLGRSSASCRSGLRWRRSAARRRPSCGCAPRCAASRSC